MNPLDVNTVLNDGATIDADFPAHQDDPNSDSQHNAAAVEVSSPPDGPTPSQEPVLPDSAHQDSEIEALDTVATSEGFPLSDAPTSPNEPDPSAQDPAEDIHLSGAHVNVALPEVDPIFDASVLYNEPEPGLRNPAQDPRLSYTDSQLNPIPLEVAPASDTSILPNEPASVSGSGDPSGQDTGLLEPEAPNITSSYTSTPRNVHTPLPIGVGDTLEPPRASYLLPTSDISTPRDSYAPGSDNSYAKDSSYHLAGDKPVDNDVEDASAPKTRQSKFKRPAFLIVALLAIIVIIIAVIVPVYFTVIKKHTSSATTSGNGTPTGSGGATPTASGSGPTATSGGDGSLITTETGETFTYTNPFGGFWVSDPNDPFNNNARANSFTPSLNTSWTWGRDRVYGVNLGGLFVLEPFITPALYQRYPGAVDEWTLSTLMAADTTNGGLSQLEQHYQTFVTEQDIAEMAGAGLNWIRLPIPFWAIETWDGEPFLAKVSWKYILKIFAWARKYGIRVNLDLHTIPGSQNGYNHSGKLGMINFLNGVMGIANAQRTLGYIRIIAEFISQPEYLPVVPVFSIINEPLPGTIGIDQLSSFYFQAYNTIRSITGIGGNNGPFIAIHDGFIGIARWAGFFTGSDRIMLDTHPYFAFNGGANTAPISTGTGADAGGTWPAQACSWGDGMNTSQTAFGVTIAGEFSNGFNDCGLFVDGVGGVATYGGNCSQWEDSSTWDAPTKAGIEAFALASMDALQNWFFWTWKIGNSTSGTVESPLWSYQLGFRNGWMPTDPRQAIGKCASLGVSNTQFDGTYLPWQTGGAGAGTLAQSVTASFGQWPPTSLNGIDTPADASLLPLYTATGTVATLPPPTLTASATHSISVGDGWYDAADTASGITTIQGCTYPDPWSASGIAIPTVCPGGAVATALVTPAPK